MRILIAESDHESRFLLERLLIAEEFEVKALPNGREALDAVHRDPPDLIISSILMPLTDGFEFCRALKKAGGVLGEIPFIFYTAAYAEDQDRDYGLVLGAHRYFIKPAQLSDLISAVVQYRRQFDAGEPFLSDVPDLDRPDTLVMYLSRLTDKLRKQVEELEDSRTASLVRGTRGIPRS